MHHDAQQVEPCVYLAAIQVNANFPPCQGEALVDPRPDLKRIIALPGGSLASGYARPEPRAPRE
jgi:hypothetical protein